jgi:hypothetical protein
MSHATLPAPAPSLVLYLNPYDGSPGEYVHDADELRAVLARFIARWTEEWETQVIDAEHPRIMQLAVKATPDQELFELADMLDDRNAPAVFYILDNDNSSRCVLDARALLRRADDVSLFEGTAEDYADSILDDLYDIPPALRSYFDCEALGRDMEIGGDIATFEYEGCCYVVTNPND